MYEIVVKNLELLDPIVCTLWDQYMIKKIQFQELQYKQKKKQKKKMVEH